MVLDIGNSAVKAGLYQGDVLHHTFRAAHDATSLATTLRSEIESFPVRRAGIASVVPQSSEVSTRVLSDAGIAVTHIRPTMHFPFALDYRTLDTLGADRLAAAVAAWLQYGGGAKYGRGEKNGGRAKYGGRATRNVIVLDAGTAMTCDVITRDGVYLGGTITPGPLLMQRALNRETAQLPDVPLSLPAGPIGQSTIESIQAGVMYGFVESVGGLLRRIEQALDGDVFVVVTGGWSSLLKEHVSGIDSVSPYLVLEGIRRLMELNE